MADRSDLELIRWLREADRAGREEAFAELFERHSGSARDLAYRVLGDLDLAGDVVQEVFLSLFRDGVNFEERARFSSWLYRVVLNRAIDLRRRERMRRRLGSGAGADTDAGGEDALDRAAAREKGPDGELLAGDRAAAVRAAIHELSPKLAEVVVLRYPQGLSYEEIGEILGVPPGTVKSRLNRAHEALRELLGDWLDEV